MELLKTVIEQPSDDSLSLLWKHISTEKIYCMNIEHYIYYKFNKKTCLYDLIGLNEFSDIVNNELKKYLVENSKVNTDKRLTDLITKIGNVSKSKKVGESASYKIYDKSFNIEFYKKLESKKNVINFKNGFVNLQTGTFHNRTENDYFIKCLDYDYIKETNKSIELDILQIFKRICNDDEKMFNFMLSWFSYCITGETKEQKSLFTIGLKASNGKSTASKIFDRCFKQYTRKLTNEFLKVNYTLIHKELAELKGIRYAYMEEYPKNVDLNVDMYKDLVDGNSITNKVMYGTTDEIQITFKINILSNHLPKFEADKGIKRRGLLCELNNCFLDKDDYKKAKNTYLLDSNLLNKFEEDVYKQTFFNILLKYSMEYYATGLKVFNELKTGFNEICAENDKMASFIESLFDITNEPNDRLYKEHFVRLYNEKYNLRKDWSSLITDVKKAGLLFKPNERVMFEGKSERGVIVGIKLRLIEDENEEDNIVNKLYPALQKIDNEKEDEIIKLKREIIELKEHIFDLYKIGIEPVKEEENIEIVKEKPKKSKKQKNISKDIIEKKEEIKEEINIDVVFCDPVLSQYF